MLRSKLHYIPNGSYLKSYADLKRLFPGGRFIPLRGKRPYINNWYLRGYGKYDISEDADIGLISDIYIKLDIDCERRLLNTLLYKLHCQILNVSNPMTIESRKGLSVIVKVELPGSVSHMATCRELKKQFGAQVETIGSYRQQFAAGSKNHSVIAGDIVTVTPDQLRMIIDESQQLICDFYSVANNFPVKVKKPLPLSNKYLPLSKKDLERYVDVSVGNYIVKRRAVGAAEQHDADKHIARVDRIAAGLLRYCKDFYPDILDWIVVTLHEKLNAYYKDAITTIPLETWSNHCTHVLMSDKYDDCNIRTVIRYCGRINLHLRERRYDFDLFLKWLQVRLNRQLSGPYGFALRDMWDELPKGIAKSTVSFGKLLRRWKDKLSEQGIVMDVYERHPKIGNLFLFSISNSNYPKDSQQLSREICIEKGNFENLENNTNQKNLGRSQLSRTDNKDTSGIVVTDRENLDQKISGTITTIPMTAPIYNRHDDAIPDKPIIMPPYGSQWMRNPKTMAWDPEYRPGMQSIDARDIHDGMSEQQHAAALKYSALLRYDSPGYPYAKLPPSMIREGWAWDTQNSRPYPYHTYHHPSDPVYNVVSVTKCAVGWAVAFSDDGKTVSGNYIYTSTGKYPINN